jgi:hypothetical protein
MTGRNRQEDEDRGRTSGTDEPDDLRRAGTAPGLSLGEDHLAVDQHVELSQAAPPDPGRHAEALREVLPEAHGLLTDVASEEAALDFDVHERRIAGPEEDVT